MQVLERDLLIVAIRQMGIDGVEVALRQRDVVDQPLGDELPNQPHAHVEGPAAIGELIKTEPNADCEIGRRRSADAAEDFPGEANSVVPAAAPAVAALVRERRHELLQQMPLRAMHFDPVEARLRHVLAGHDGVLDEVCDFVAGHGARHTARARTGNRGRPDRLGQNRGAVVLASAVIDLTDHQRAGGVHGFGPARQTGDDLRIEAGNVAAAHHRRWMKPHRLGDDNAGPAAGERRVVRQQSLGNVELFGQIGRRRRTEYAVSRLAPADPQRRKQMGKCLFRTSVHAEPSRHSALTMPPPDCCTLIERRWRPQELVSRDHALLAPVLGCAAGFASL